MSIRYPQDSQLDRIGRAEGVPVSGPLASVRYEPRPTGLTYEPFYGLKEKPFSLTSDARFFYHSRSHAPAFDDLLEAIRRRESLNVLTGDIGTGKTTLCRAVLDDLDRKTFSAFVPDPFASREDLLKVVLMDFGVISAEDLTSGRLKNASRTELSYVLYEFLATLAPLQAFAVVIIDEAQNLSLPLLEEIRILSDADGQLQVVLVGQLELCDKLALPEMRQVEQRVSVHANLSPLACDGVAGYVAHRLQTAGGSPDRVRFSPDAIDTLYRMSGGVPRLINRLCDRALHQGYVRRAATIDTEILEASIPAHVRSTAAPEVVAASERAVPPTPAAAAAPIVPATPVVLSTPIPLATPLGAVVSSGPASIASIPDAASKTAQGPDPIDAWIAAVDERTASIEFASESAIAPPIAPVVQPSERMRPRGASRGVTPGRGQRTGLRFVLPPQVKPSRIDRVTRKWRHRLGIAALAITSIGAALIGASTLIDITADMWAATTQIFAPPDMPGLPPAKQLVAVPELKVPPMNDAFLQNASDSGIPAGIDPAPDAAR